MKRMKIRNLREYRDALAEIDALMNRENLTKKESSRLDELVYLVELYEDDKYPIAKVDPVSAIQFRMEQEGLKQKDLIPFIGDKSKVSQVLNGKRSLSKTMIENLHNGLGIPLESLMGLDAKLTPNLDEQELIEWSRFPVKEMIKKGWLSLKKNIRIKPEDYQSILQSFFPGIQYDFFMPLKGKNTYTETKKPDPYSLKAWQLMVLKKADSEKLTPKFQFRSITHEFRTDLGKLSYFNHGPLLAQEYLNKNGIHLIILEHLPKTYLDGAAMMSSSGKPIIAMTLRYDRLDNFWFVLFHELAHVALHLSKDSNLFFLENFDDLANTVEEQEANNWAANSLIPPELWDIINLDIHSSSRQIQKFSDTIRIHPSIPAGRIRWEAKNYKIFNNLVGNGQVRNLFEQHKQ